MNTEQLIKGATYLYTAGTVIEDATFLHHTINHCVFACAGKEVRMSSSQVRMYIREKRI